MAVYKFAGFWRRLVAYTVDNIIINIVFLILTVIIATAFMLGSLSGNSWAWVANLTDPARITSLGLLVIVFYIALSTAYFTYFHGIKGRTPGKMLLGLQVLSADSSPLNFGIAFLRAVGYLVSGLLFTIPLGFIWAAFDKRKQGWHDKIAGTVVIMRPDEDEAAGLTIPEPQAVRIIAPADERQSENISPSSDQSSETAAGENKAVTGHPGNE